MSIGVSVHVAQIELKATLELWSAVVLWKADFTETSMDEKQPQQQPGQMQIKAEEKELQGLYSNLMMIHHNVEEFTLNFVYIFPNGTQGKLLSSMIVSPGHAKRIWRALGENISRYEAQFGTIKEAPEPGGPIPTMGFVQ
jgi:hypothetical protein